MSHILQTVSCVKSHFLSITNDLNVHEYPYEVSKGMIHIDYRELCEIT